MDRQTLGLIWAGNITMWNDTRIKDLNGPIANKLPGEKIHMAYNEGNNVSLAEVMKIALEKFSPDFQAALERANRSWSLLPPALEGRSNETGVFDEDRLQFLTVPLSPSFSLESQEFSA
jgi:hypothetical protein